MNLSPGPKSNLDKAITLGFKSRSLDELDKFVRNLGLLTKYKMEKITRNLIGHVFHFVMNVKPLISKDFIILGNGPGSKSTY